MRVALVGNPNAGKSTVFNALTGGHAKVGNWHGVTVTRTEGTALIANRKVEVVDLPGIYSLLPMTGEEGCTVDFLRSEQCFVLFVAECAHFMRSLSLLRELLSDRKGGVILTKLNAFEKRGGRVDEKMLSRSLGVPVFCFRSPKGADVRLLRQWLGEVLKGDMSENLEPCPPKNRSIKGKCRAGTCCGNCLLKVASPKPSDAVTPSGAVKRMKASDLSHSTLKPSPSSVSLSGRNKTVGSLGLPERVAGYIPQTEKRQPLDRLFCDARFCIAFFIFFLAVSFFVTFANGLLGDWMKTLITDGFSLLSTRAETISQPVLRSFICKGVLSGASCVFSFLPQIALLFFFLLLLEESGVMARLAMNTDGFLSKFGLSGRAVFSLLMGFGCTAAAILTTRGLNDKSVQKRAIGCLPYFSCSAKLPVYVTIASSFFENPFPFVLLLYVAGIAVALLFLVISGGGKSPDFIMEFPDLQLPQPILLIKSLLFQIKQFIIKTATVVFVFFLLSWLLSSFDFSFRLCGEEDSMLAAACRPFAFVFAPIGCGDWRMTYAALSGLAAKENVAGILAMFYGGFPFSLESGIAFSLFLLTCSPCISAISATAAELGVKRAVGYAAAQTASALLLSYVSYFLMKAGWIAWVIGLIAVTVAICILRKKKREKIHGSGGRYAQKVYR